MNIKAVCLALLAACAATAQPASTGGSLNEKAWTILDAGSKDKGYANRVQTATALGLIINNSKAEQMATEALKDKAFEVRTAAAAALGEMNASGAAPVLKEALKDTDLGVVLAAASSLDKLNDPAAYQVYYQILTGKRKEGMMGADIKGLHDPKQLAKFTVEQGIAFVPFAGAGYGAMKYIIKDDSALRATSVGVLSKDNDKQTQDALREHAKVDKKWLVQVAAIRALATHGDPADADVLAGLLTHEKPVIRYTAAAAIIRLSAKR